MYYDRKVATWPASYVSIFYPATLSDGRPTPPGGLTATGAAAPCSAPGLNATPAGCTPLWGIPGSARASASPQKLNLHGLINGVADGSTAWPRRDQPVPPRGPGRVVLAHRRRAPDASRSTRWTSAASTGLARTPGFVPSRRATQSPRSARFREEKRRNAMRSNSVLQFAMGCFLAAATFAATDAHSDPGAPRQVTPSGPGFAGVYGQMPASQVEFISTAERDQERRGQRRPDAHLGDARARREGRVPRLHLRGRPAPLRLEREEPRDRGVVATSPHLRRLRSGRGLRADAPDPADQHGPRQSVVRGLRAGRVLPGPGRRRVRDGPSG